ncbi:trypsin-like peptidase domain-containing protein [Zhongshania sp.]|uniref:trypsin-like peptidase domain-containing protein n=1 Tax=Zhongshania sp. TaxID=1971902 RepID=UPI003568EABC
MIKQSLLLLLFIILSACGGSSSTSSPTRSTIPSSGSIPNSQAVPSADHIRPGVEIVADGSSCTSNFLFSPNPQTVYIGVAAHCFSPDTNSGVDPCESNNLAIGYNEISIANASEPGELVYTSWRAMQEAGETVGSDICQYNDFALVKIHPNDLANVHPAAIAFGGPTALFTGTAAVGAGVFAYGQSPLHFGVRSREAKKGQITGVLGDGWAYDIVTDTPSLSGDSGGPIFTADGKALAATSVLSLSVSVNPVSNGVVNLERALQYAKNGGFINSGTKLLTWSEFHSGGDL